MAAKTHVYSFEKGDGKNKKLLGGKGANLCEMTQIGLRVPPGFVITTEVFRGWEIINSYPPAKRNFAEQVIHHIQLVEQKTNRRFAASSGHTLCTMRAGLRRHCPR